MQSPFHGSPFEYASKASTEDYKFWLVVDPSKFLMPILFTVLVIALVVHNYAMSLPGRGFKTVAAPAVVAPAVVVAPAPAG
jgi:light-harvesting protein B-800-850 alpha chain